MRVRQGGVTSRRIGTETILLDLETSRYMTINKSGTILLRMLREDRDRAELVAAVENQFDVPREIATKDVDAFLALLDSVGLLERRLVLHPRSWRGASGAQASSA